jgi:hypothetical protein
MRNILLAIALVALLPASVALGEQPRGQKSDKRADKALAGKPLPIKGAGNSNSCAAYGPGFVRIDGTETCMKIGGAISIGAGSSIGGR